MRVARISWEPTESSRDTLGKAKGVTLIPLRSEGSQGDQVGGWSLWSEVKSLKTISRDNQARVHSDQMVLVMVRLGGSVWAVAKLKSYTFSS